MPRLHLRLDGPLSARNRPGRRAGRGVTEIHRRRQSERNGRHTSRGGDVEKVYFFMVAHSGVESTALGGQYDPGVG